MRLGAVAAYLIVVQTVFGTGTDDAVAIMPLRLAKPIVYNLSPHCDYKIAAANARDPGVMLMSSSEDWRPHAKVITSLGTKQGTLWLRCSVENHSTEKSWRIVSQYAFAKQTTVFVLRSGKITELERNGRSFWYRNDGFKVSSESLATAKTIFLVRFEFDLAKVAYLQIMPEALYEKQERLESSLFLIFSAILALALMLNLILAAVLRNLLPLLYCFTAFTVYQYQMVQLGFGNIFYYPNFTEFNGNMVSISAGGALIFFQIFFQSLLKFREITPRLNRVMNVIALFSVVYIGVSAASLLPIALLQRMGRLLFFVSMIIVLWAGWIVYRKHYRPALYSIYGYAVIGICQVSYFVIMAGLVDSGGLLVKLILPVGQIIEYGFFFTTLTLRLRDRDQALQLQSIADDAKLNREVARDAMLRLSPEKITTVSAKLEDLFEREKYYKEENISLKGLADKIGVTRHELSDLLNKKFQSNFYEYVNRYRIREAEKILLENPDAKVLHVAMAVGFNSKSTFNKEFKRLTGRTPTEVRVKTA